MTQTASQPETAEETPLRASDFPMTGLALLGVPAWEPGNFRGALLTDWAIDPGMPPATQGEPWIFHANGSLVVIGFEPRPVPEHGADLQAKNTPEWPEAVEIAHAHQAYLAVAVIAETVSLVENARTAMKVLCSLASQPNVRAINAASKLFPPDNYRAAALQMKGNDKIFPVWNIIFFGAWTPEGSDEMAGYTVGLDRFGLPELEIPAGPGTSTEIRGRLVHAAMIQVTRGHALAEGEEIKLPGFTYRCAKRPSEALPDVETVHLDRVD